MDGPLVSLITPYVTKACKIPSNEAVKLGVRLLARNANHRRKARNRRPRCPKFAQREAAARLANAYIPSRTPDQTTTIGSITQVRQEEGVQSTADC